MNKIKYALNHGKIVILILMIAVFFISSLVFDAVSQLNSQKDGIEMLFVSTYISGGSSNTIVKNITNETNVKYVGAATIDEKDTREYIKQVSDYSFSDYLYDITTSKNAELIFVTESVLPEVYQMKNIVPLEIDGTFDSVCYNNGVLYALPLKNVVINQNSNVVSLQQDTYVVLLEGDHTQDAHQYLSSLITEEK